MVAKLNVAKEEATQAVDIVRKATMHGTLYMFISLLIGAFVASYFAAIGGRNRDAY